MNEALGVPAQPESDSTPGALLKRERERRALSLQQAAEDLHLDPWVIEAIEANRFQALGAPVYAKGHLRKYATRLELPVEELIKKYEGLTDRPVTADPIPVAIAAPLPPPRRSLKVPLLISLSLLVLAAAVWIAVELFVQREEPPEQPTLAAAEQASASIAPEAAAPPVETVAAPHTSAQPPVAAAAIEVPASQAPAAPAATARSAERPAPTDAAIQLRLHFSGDSWTEVYDAQGTRLMFAMGSEGRTRTLSGVPPLQVTLGSVSAVSLEVNGETVAIPRREGRESSRFVIDSSGNLR